MPEPKIETKKDTKGTETPIKVEEKKQPAPDPYLLWMQNNQQIKPDDVAVYKKPDGSKMVVFTDGIGRSLLNCSLHLSKDVMDKINKDEDKK